MTLCLLQRPRHKQLHAVINTSGFIFGNVLLKKHHGCAKIIQAADHMHSVYGFQTEA